MAGEIRARAAQPAADIQHWPLPAAELAHHTRHHVVAGRGEIGGSRKEEAKIGVAGIPQSPT